MMGAVLIAYVFAGWRIARRTRFYLHLFQLEGYKQGPYFRWILGHLDDAVFRASHLLGVIWLIVLLLAGGLLPRTVLILMLILWAATFASSRRYRRDRPKKPISYTFRMRRLIGMSAVLLLLPVLAGILASQGASDSSWVLSLLAGLFVADLASPVFVSVAGFFMIPVERRIQDGFKKSARQILAARSDLDIIAITGSYGKTSVKNAVRGVLSHRHSVLVTPGSFNTPMGVCKVINGQLAENHRILVLEMGIRHAGDIAELCDIARPDIALITSIGVAHLESMGSVDAIAEEKGSLLEWLPSDGHAVLNADDERVRELGERFRGRTWFVSTDANNGSEITATKIEYGPDGASFIVSDETGEECLFRTRLVGQHNVTNILMALAVGRIYGVRLRQLRRAIERLEPVPHRLEIRKSGSITIIDDAFNSNPVGARNAVEILGQFQTGRRIIVTPGMIELGDQQDSANRELGTQIARNADLAVLVGIRQTSAISEGLHDAGFSDERIHIVRSLYEANEFLESYLRDGDVVLYENDLPDQFNEK